MDSSKEDLLEMTELASPTRKLPRIKLKKSNQIHSPSFVSPARSTDRDLTSLFSVKQPPRNSSPGEGDTETISEISDDILLSENLTKSRSGTSSGRKINKLKKSWEKLCQESSQVDTNIKTLRDKFQFKENGGEVPEVSFFKFEEPRLSDEDTEQALLPSHYLPPENLQFNIQVAERDNYTTAKEIHIEGSIANPVTTYSIKPDVLVQRGECIMYYSPNQLDNMQEVVIIKDNILELCLGHLQFVHHPLFSLEHCLEEKLRCIFLNYYRYVEENVVETLKEDFRAAKGDTKKPREKLFTEAKNERECLKSILDIWRALKKLRSHQNYSNTSVRLIIKKEECDFDLESQQYDIFFEETLLTLIEEHKAGYKRKLREYNRKLKAKDQTDLEKPTLNINRNELAMKLKAQFSESFRSPGEPRLTLLLKYDHQLTKEITDNQEADRRKVTSTTKFTLKILCNEISVSKSRPATLDNTFLVDFNEVISIQLTHIPQCLCLEVYEHPKGLLKKKIAELKVDIPAFSILYGEVPYAQATFERKEIVHYKHAGVGSGYSLPVLLKDLEIPLDVKLEGVELYTKGNFVYKIGWSSSQAKTGLSETEIESEINKWGSIDEAYGEGCNLEENYGYFRLHPEDTFCKMDALQHNIRLQYLKLRDQHEMEFDGVLIANRIREIPFSLLKDFRKRKALEALQDEEEEDPDSLRESGKRRLAQIQSRIFYQCKCLENNLSYESVVNEKYLVYLEDLIRTSLKNLLNWFRWQPRLSKPLPRLLDKPSKPQLGFRSKIQMKIFCGKNMPRRKVVDHQAFALEVNFDDFISRTCSVEGGDPVWNELVELPLQQRHSDYLDPNSLTGTISMNLVDQKSWLGEVKIPISAFSTDLSLSGWFKVQKPPGLLGYQIGDDQHATKSPKHECNGAHTYVRLDISVAPPMPSFEPPLADLPSNDVPYIRDHMIKWNDIFNLNFPNKKFSVLALDTRGRTNCITRYINPLEPPQLSQEEFDMTPEQCLRYVSLIPFTERNGFYQNVWLTSDQLLSFMIGSVIDHCVALTCFLLALKMDAYLLLGYGIPHGFTSYVLLSEYTRDCDLPNYYILDVFYNEKFHLADPFCPLRRVYCVINGENVWGNVQRTPNPAFLRFDLGRRSDWWPMFGPGLSAPTNFLNNRINFALRRDFEDLERHLERKLRRGFSKWRPMERTNFNLRVCEAYKNTLRTCELNAMYGRSHGETLMDVNKALGQFTVMGTILNLPFIGLNSLVKKIKDLNLHVQPVGVTEFGLSAFIQCYPGQVVSVWIFIGSVCDSSSL